MKEFPSYIPENTQEKKGRHEVYTANLEKLRSGEMFEAVGAESQGGNAGRLAFEGKNYTPVAVNFYADPETGQIVRFTNYGEINAVFYVISVGTVKNWYRRILGFEARGLLSDKAKNEIQLAIDGFNSVGRDMYEFGK